MANIRPLNYREVMAHAHFNEDQKLVFTLYDENGEKLFEEVLDDLKDPSNRSKIAYNLSRKILPYVESNL